MIRLKSLEEIEMIAESGKILAKIFRKLIKEIEVGSNLNYLNKLVLDLTKRTGAKPAFLGYKPSGAKHPYGAAICASINDIVVHGFPSDYQLKSGDVLKIDFGVMYKNFYSDAAITVGVGHISQKVKDLIETTKLALEKAIEQAKPGNTLGDLGWIIQKTAETNGFKIIKSLTGHGIGFELHEDPTIYNYGQKGKGIKLKPGMVLAIEPMLAIGSDKVVQKPDESWATADGSLAAHFEHTVAITEKGPKALTKI